MPSAVSEFTYVATPFGATNCESARFYDLGLRERLQREAHSEHMKSLRRFEEEHGTVFGKLELRTRLQAPDVDGWKSAWFSPVVDPGTYESNG